MTLKEAVKLMIDTHRVVFSDGARDWEADELLAAIDEEGDALAHEAEPFIYSVGPSFGRPGVYRLREGFMESVPIYEPRTPTSNTGFRAEQEANMDNNRRRWLDEREYVLEQDEFFQRTVVRDANKDFRFSVPISWTEEIIVKAIYIANVAYSEGCTDGKHAKVKEIRDALGL